MLEGTAPGEASRGDGEGDRLVLEGLRLLPAAGWVASRAEGASVLDLTEATRLVSGYLSSRGVHAVSVMTEAPAADVLKDEFSGRVDVRCCDLGSLPFADGHFRAAITRTSVLARRPVDPLLEEIKRVLQPEGVIAVVLDSTVTGLGNVESLLSSYFRHSTQLPQVNHIVSRLGTAAGSEDRPNSVSGPSRSRAGEALVVASDNAAAIRADPVLMIDAVDIEAIMDSAAAAIRKAHLAQGEARRAAGAAKDRDHLLRELYLSEQALAEAFDIRTRFETTVSAAARQQEELKEARTTIGSLAEQLEAARQQITALHAAYLAEHDLVVALKSSTSWQITQPLRAITGRLRSS